MSTGTDENQPASDKNQHVFSERSLDTINTGTATGTAKSADDVIDDE